MITTFFQDKDLNRYYLCHLFDAFAAAGKVRFSMSYLFFFGGLTLQDVILNMGLFAISALLWIYPTALIINKIGARKTHFLHLIPKIITSIILIVMLFKVQAGENIKVLFFSWMVVHGIALMLKRISMNAYFSHYGKNESRGRNLAFMQCLTTVTAVISPLLFGSLIDQGLIAYIIIIASVLSIVSACCIGFKYDDNIKIDVDIKHIHKIFPKNIKKALFLPNLAYPFMDDLFFIWILIIFDKSFTLAGGFMAFKLILDLILSSAVGYAFDKKNIVPFYKISIFVTALFWFICPFLSTDWFSSNLPEGWTIVAVFLGLQVTLGLATLVWNEPFDAWYHNATKKSDEVLGFSLYREILVNAGLLFGAVIGYTFISIVDNWYWGILLAVPASLARLYIIPRKGN